MIEIRDLSKRIETKQILEHISFSLKEGDVLGLVGANGAGKSTLIRIIAGILSPDQGQILYGSSSAPTSIPKKSIAYVPQDIVLYEDMTVYENLLLFGRGKTDLPTLSEQIRKLTDTLSLQPYLKQKVSALSGGLKRRVNIAAAMTGNIKLALLDEPVVGIDIGKTKDVEALIHQLSKQGCLTVLSSHSVDFLKNTCNRLLVLEKGGLFYFGDFDTRYLKNVFGEIHE